MTITEATTIAGWIQKAFPHMQMTPQLYVRALVHYDYEVASEAVLSAITSDWKMLPKVAEVVAVVRETTPPKNPQCETCANDRMVWVSETEVAPCPDCHPLSGEDYFMAGKGKNVRAHVKDNMRAVDPAWVRDRMSA